MCNVSLGLRIIAGKELAAMGARVLAELPVLYIQGKTVVTWNK